MRFYIYCWRVFALLKRCDRKINNFLFRPNKNEVDSEYVDAMEAGNYGVDCSKMYRKCLPGHGILDNISYLKYN